ncbi:hypothetical protein Z517_07881 [Fonsecaea pedrosoi CBS 271.37]|uniref:Uncharacterized protein n=1 Tax=Fonsecaea pedrosoi CBS 271.37 TaxID=1442368 RepID=A0A0D2GBQ6_9EURO|nr:uncharacterized protein Z517_07881 [Fonsecaea pedrosoi CBS 271.37]KIW78048.1 hypothetical protein Z517_07881 [Fonsecaea pedrosoi CBS 271.37]
MATVPEQASSMWEFLKLAMAEDSTWEDYGLVVTRLCIFYFIYHLARHQILSAIYEAAENPEAGLPQLQQAMSRYLKDIMKTLHAGALLLLMAHVLGIPGTTIVCYILITFFFLQEGRGAITTIYRLVTPFMSRCTQKCKDSFDLVAIAFGMVLVAWKLCSTTWHLLCSLKSLCAKIVNWPHWSTLKNAWDSMSRPVLRCLQKRKQFVAALVNSTSELLFRLRGGREALRAALLDNAQLREANARLAAEIARFRSQAEPKDKRGIWIRERVLSGEQPHWFQLELVRKLRQDCRAAHKESQRWREAFEERQGRIAELEACDGDADAHVEAATARRDGRVRALEAEKTAVVASATSKVNAMTTALEAEKAESHKLRSSLKAQEAKSGDLESRLGSEKLASQRLGEEVAVLRRERDAESALLEKVRMEAAQAERAAADQVRGQKDAEISVLKAQLAEAQVFAAVVVVDTAEIGVQTDLTAEASPVIPPVDVNEAGTQTECIGLDIQSQQAASANLEIELLSSKEALGEKEKELAAYQQAWKKTSDDLVSCNGDLQKALKEANELRSWNTKGGQELEQRKRDVEHLRQLISYREQEAANLQEQLKQCKESAEQQKPVAEEVKYWRGRAEALSTDMAKLRSENLDTKAKLAETQQKFENGAKQYYALRYDTKQQLDTKEKSYKELEKQLKAELQMRDRDVQVLMQNSQVESLQKQVMSKDDEICDLRREIDQHKLNSEVAVSTPRSDRIGSSPFPTPTKTPVTKILENKVREHAEDMKKHAIEKQQLETRIAAQAQDLQNLWDTKEQLEQEKLRLEAENKKLQDQMTDEAMDVAFAKEFFEEDKEDIKQAQEAAENWKTQLDEAQASVQNMQLDLQFKEGQVDAARMQADLYKKQAQDLEVQQEPRAQIGNPPTLLPRPQKRIASSDIQDGKPIQDTKKILTKRHYQGVLPSTRLQHAHMAQAQQGQAPRAPQAQVFQHLQAQIVHPPQAQANQAVTSATEQAEENADDSSIISEEE